jgi:cyanate permease
LTGKKCKKESDVKGDVETVPALSGASITFIQINLHHSKSASALLAWNMAVMQTGIAIRQEPWTVKGIIRGLCSGGKGL